MTGSWKRWLVPLLCSVLVAAPAAAQEGTGVITGRVTAEGATQPLTDARVLVAGTQLFASTGGDGRYTIRGVPAGTHSLRVLRVGYTQQRRDVTVAAGQTTTADFQLAATVVQLDQVMVSATGTTERKRENGTDVGIIKPGEVTSTAATPTLTNVLAAKTPGLTITQNAGTLGSGARVRIRGANSISLSNEPLLIIDGVRVDNNTQSNFIGIGGVTTSRFDDINPEDIESIEVLKGPAASALYGTAAANGVIQVTTKRGHSGRTQWRAYAQGGSLEDPTHYQDNYFVAASRATSATTPYPSTCTLDARTQGLCKPLQLFSFNPVSFFGTQKTGYTSDFGLSAGGGSEQAQYFLSGDFSRGQGVADPNKLKSVSVRANINARLRPNLTAQVTTNYIDKLNGLPNNDNNIYGAIPNGMLGKAAACGPGNTAYIPVGTGRAGPCVLTSGNLDTLTNGFYSRIPSAFYYMINQEQTRRFVGGSNITWQINPWLTGTGQVGADVGNIFNEHVIPSGILTTVNATLTNGEVSNYRRQLLNYNASGYLTAQRTLTTTLQSTTTAGGQFIQEQNHYTYGFGRNLAFGTKSLAGASAGAIVNQLNQTINTVGVLAREQLAWRDRVFLTGSIRADENSAFGENFKLAYYPAASASWVVSEESFLRDLGVFQSEMLSQLRLRGAFGKSGQRPGFRQANSYYQGTAVASGGTELSAVAIGGLGNPNLKPEISTEFEGGFDVGLLRNRASFTYTAYRKTTRDALVQRIIAPSAGAVPTGAYFTGSVASQFANLGLVRNAGQELTLTATALDQPNYRLELSANAAFNSSRILDLGDVPPIVFNAARQRHQEGFPMGAFFQRHYTYEDKNGNHIIERSEVTLGDTASAAQYIGNVLPTREISFAPALTIYQRVRLAALVQHRGGNYVYNNSEEFRCGYGNCRAVNDSTAPLADQAAAIGNNIYGTSYGYIEKGDFTKLREVSVTLTAPKSWAAAARVADLSLVLAGRNLYTWKTYKGADPEINSTNNAFSQFDFFAQPPLRSFTARLDLSF